MTTSTDQASLEQRIGPRGRFHIRMMSGSIRVSAVEGDTVRVRERHGRSLAEAFRIEGGSDSLTMTSNEKFGGVDFIVFSIGRRSSLDIEAQVPSGARVTIETASAEIGVSGMAGPVKLRTASGDVRLDDQRGPVELDAVSGDAQVVATGPLDLRARTISGDLTVRGPRLERATIETTSGDVRLDALLEGPGPFQIQTVTGDATIVGRSGIRVEARTVTGDLRSDLPNRRDTAPGRKMLIVGDGGTPLGFRSVSGDLRVIAPRDAMAPTAAGDRRAPMPPEAPEAPAAQDARHAPAAPVEPAASATETAQLAQAAGHEVARLDVLHALERGDLSVEAAMARLAEIEEA